MNRKRPGGARGCLRQLCPPLVWNGLKSANAAMRRARRRQQPGDGSSEQDLGLYWDPGMAALLDAWGEDNVWKEIQLLLVDRPGPVLDIACGTGRVIEILSALPLEIHGCDISGLLIDKALARGIPASRLTVCDATRLPYDDGAFEYTYSIGSLEHFTEDGISRFLSESNRVCRTGSFHNIPVSRSGRNEGWITPQQSYFNNSVAWWLAKFEAACESVTVIDSTWEDDRSVGKWFVSVKPRPGHRP